MKWINGAAVAALMGMAGAVYAAAPAMPGQTDKGQALVDSSGMVLYTFDKDAKGESACTDQCAKNWPPLAAAAGASAEGDWTVVKREDGSSQWAYKGKPLYTWVKDKEAGKAGGDGVGGVWHIAKP